MGYKRHGICRYIRQCRTRCGSLNTTKIIFEQLRRLTHSCHSPVVKTGHRKHLLTSFIYIYIHTHAYIYIYTYIHTHRDTHIHIDINPQTPVASPDTRVIPSSTANVKLRTSCFMSSTCLATMGLRRSQSTQPSWKTNSMSSCSRCSGDQGWVHYVS